MRRAAPHIKRIVTHGTKPMSASARGPRGSESSSCAGSPATSASATSTISTHGFPNYRLRACHEGDDNLRAAPALTLWTALRQWRFTLWDSERQRMVELPKRSTRTKR